MYSPETDPANTTHRNRLELSSRHAEQVANDLSALHINGGHEGIDYRTQDQTQMYGPLRMMSAAGPAAKDITAEFSTAASALETGQLVKDSFFTLFESVSAIEIMDPKMDSGYLQPGETLEDEYDVMRKLLPEEVLGIMDQILCFEMAWQMGNPLSQTLFISFYLDRMLWPEPKTLDQARFDRDNRAASGNEIVHIVLRAYCLGVVKSCDLVHRTISSELYYEEEDFVTNTYHRNLLTEFQSSEIDQLLDNAIDWLEAASTIENGIRAALQDRLRFRRAFILALDLGQGITDAVRPGAWRECIKDLDGICQTKNLGIAVRSAFSKKIQRRLASSVPPRPVVNISFDEAHAFLARMCAHGEEAYSILRYSGPLSAMNFVWNFQSRQPLASVYIRCLVQSLILHDALVLDQRLVRRFLFDSLEEMVLPGSILIDAANDEVEAPHDPRFQILKKMRDFITRTADAYFDMFRTLCMNRSRMRRMLCHLAIDWDNIQLDAEAMDVDFRPLTKERPIVDPKAPEGEIWSFPLSSWAFYHKLQQMEWIIQLGFELDIYRIDELGGMYWYLQHLASTRIQHLERMRTFTNRRLSQSKPSSKTKEAYANCFSLIDFAMLQASATQSFADGISCFFAFLAHTAILPAPYANFPYSDPSLRYALRMRPFLGLSIPEVPTYPEFAALASLNVPSEVPNPQTKSSSSTKPTHQALTLLDSAAEALKNARKEWEAVSKAPATMARTTACEAWWQADVKNVLRACIMANIAVGTTKKAVAGMGKGKKIEDILKVDVDKEKRGYHGFWIVPRVAAL